MNASGSACRYAIGDASVAETCDSFCSRSGQGHTHFLPCDPSRCASGLHDGVRHNMDTRIAAGHIGAQDEHTHESFWVAQNIDDPCRADERPAFAKCGNYCASEEHFQVCGLVCAPHVVLIARVSGSDEAIGLQV